MGTHPRRKPKYPKYDTQALRAKFTYFSRRVKPEIRLEDIHELVELDPSTTSRLIGGYWKLGEPKARENIVLIIKALVLKKAIRLLDEANEFLYAVPLEAFPREGLSRERDDEAKVIGLLEQQQLSESKAHAKQGLDELRTEKEESLVKELQRTNEPILPPTALDLYERACSLFDEKRYEEALDADEAALKLDQQLTEAYFHKGLILYVLDRYQEAINTFDLVISLEPTNAVAYGLKGSALYKLDQDEEALQALDEALRLNPTDANTYLLKGNVLLHLGQYREGLQAYSNYLQCSPKEAKISYIAAMFGFIAFSIGSLAERRKSDRVANSAFWIGMTALATMIASLAKFKIENLIINKQVAITRAS